MKIDNGWFTCYPTSAITFCYQCVVINANNGVFLLSLVPWYLARCGEDSHHAYNFEL